MLPLWRNPESLEELAQAMVSIRREQQQTLPTQTTPAAPSVSSTTGEPNHTELSSSPPSWLPLCYEVMPLSSHWLQQQLAEKRVWILPASEAEATAPHTSSTKYLGAMVVAFSPEARRQCAGRSLLPE